jgi:hypothetical protein
LIRPTIFLWSTPAVDANASDWTSPLDTWRTGESEEEE